MSELDDLREEVRALAARCSERAHRAAGTSPRSPRYGEHRLSWRAAVRQEVRDATRSRWDRTLPGRDMRRVRAHAHGTRTRWQRNPAAAVAWVVLRQPIAYAMSYVRFVLFLIITFLLVVALVWWALAPVRDALGFIIPGTFVQPAAACSPDRPRGGVQGVAWSAGDTARRVLAAEPPSEDAIRDGFRAAARTAGQGWASFRGSLAGTEPQPTEPRPQPGAVPASTCAPTDCGGPVTVPAGGPLAPEQVAQLAAQAGWPAAEVPNVVRRVMAESSGNPTARDYADGTHHGLLQLGTAEQADYLDPGASAFDPLANLTAARRLWEARGWQPWRASDSAVAAQPTAAAPCTVPVGTPDPAGEADLSENAARARRAILARWPGTTIGGWGERPNATEHDERDPITGRKASRAIDVMTYDDMAKGDAVAAFVRANWDELNVGYLIWNRTIWLAPDRSRPYKGKSPHTDHPHITVLPDGDAA